MNLNGTPSSRHFTIFHGWQKLLSTIQQKQRQMPALTAPPSSSKASTKPPRLELPVLSSLPSLTDGTNIPPPPDSPIEEKPPVLANEAETKTAEDSDANGHAKTVTLAEKEEFPSRGRTSGVNGHANGPISPVSSHRPSSIRRFLSRKSMYNSYKSDSNGSSDNIGYRPESPATFTTAATSNSKKRSSSWFRRFTGSGSPEPPYKRTSTVFEEPRGPPAPQLPELKATDEGSLGGDDMFKKIN